MRAPSLTRRELAGSVLAVGFAWARPAHADALREVVLQPLGPSSAPLAAYAERALAAFYTVKVRAAGQMELPRSAYYAPRGRYRAEKLLSALAERHPDAFRVLGLAAVNISTTKGKVVDWGVLGLASIDGRAGVLSGFRCKRGARGPAHAAERLGKTAVHELGHTFGLEHCQHVGCLMEDGKGTVLTTDRETDLCTSCRAKLVARNLLRTDGVPPWHV